MELRAEMVANVWQVLVGTGQQVDAGTEIVILESMKMEIPIVAPVAGTAVVHVEENQVVQDGDLIATIET